MNLLYKILFKLKMSSKEDSNQIRILNPLNWVFWPVFLVLVMPFMLAAIIVTLIYEGVEENDDICWWKKQ